MVGLLGSVFTGMQAGGGLLKGLFGGDGKSTFERREDPYTTQANRENQQQKGLLGQMYQQNVGMASRNANRMVSDAQTQSLGAAGQQGLQGAGATGRALANLTSGRLGEDVMNASANATGQYAQGMQQTNEFTKGLADDIDLIEHGPQMNKMEKMGGLLQNIPQMSIDGQTQASLYTKQQPEGQRGLWGRMFGGGR